MIPASRTEVPSLHPLLMRAVCPECLGALAWTRNSALCSPCHAEFSVVGGVPILLPRTRCESDLKRRQADYFDRAVDPEFEITRPHGAPRLHQWLLEEKFRRAVAGITSTLQDATVLAVCAGSGMDAEFLALTGAHVITADISLGAARRAAERARRFDLPFASVVADVERLPFRNESVDVAYVHDGLHHLDRPQAGLAEMARVARSTICVSEPSRALATRAAVFIGFAQKREEAGNRVARFTTSEVLRGLAASGFRPVVAERYAMYYQHEPGYLVRLLSKRVLLPLAVQMFRTANRVLGRFGNKLVVQAVRQEMAR